MMGEPTGAMAVVTGAARGIGRALALKAAASGFDVALLDIDADALRDVVQEIEACGRLAVPVACDTSIEGAVERAAGIVANASENVGLVWANAGVGHVGGLVSGPENAFDWMYAVNVQGTINTLRAFVPLLVASQGVRHVGLTASVAGLSSAVERTAAYSATKHAVVGLGEALRVELAGKGIGVTIACPGLVNTEIWDGARVRPNRFGGSFKAPAAFGERHRTLGLSAVWVVDQIWAQVEKGGGYVTPVTGPDILQEFERRSEAIRSSFRFAEESQSRKIEQ